MVSSRKSRILVVVIAGAALVAVGLALAKAPARRPAPKPKPAKRAIGPGELDCKDLEKQLMACSVPIAQAFDPKLGERLAKHPEMLRGALRRTIRQEFIARVLNPCLMRKGRVEQGPLIQRCLEAAAKKARAATCPKEGDAAKPKGCQAFKQARHCQALAACLHAKAGKLPKRPRPKPAE